MTDAEITQGGRHAMTDWIEAIAARGLTEAHMRDGTVAKFATITEQERDRLVALARGVESFAADCEQTAKVLTLMKDESGAIAYRLTAAGLRRLLEEKP